jgi:predicted nucleotidyltransferase
MKPSEVFSQHRETIRRIVLESGMTNPRLFGSALHGDDTDGSDLDILVDEAPNTSLFDLAGLQIALEEALGIKVDVRVPEELHRAFRDQVVSEAIPV